MWGLLAILVFETGVWGIPPSIADQSELLTSLNRYVPARVSIGILLALLLAAAAIGPSTLRTWRDSILEWWHADARRIERQEAEIKQLRSDKAALQDRLIAYESAGAAELVANVDEPGPVPIPEDAPYVIERPKYQDSHGPIVCIVPFNGTEPAATIEVQGAENEYDVAVSYRVESVAGQYSAVAWTITLETRVQVLDDSGEPITSVGIDKADTKIDDDGSWQHAVTGHSTLIGLPKGVYALRVVDYLTTTLGSRYEARRDYRDMRLRVTRKATRR